MNPGDLLNLMHRRQSQRSYADRPVEKDKLQRCIEAARLAPSACNAQPWKFIIIDDPELKNAIAGQTTAEGLSTCILGWFNEKNQGAAPGSQKQKTRTDPPCGIRT